MRMLNISTMIPEITPPTVDMKIKSKTVMLALKNAAATAQVVTPMAIDMISVRRMVDSTFALRTVPLRRLISKVPMFMAVPILLPMAPKMLPLMPMAE